ncbi:MAG: hypothetical protein HOE90_22935 [Bacteriovoracaceae bacterium]|nr:hypothetical protein [Bacteriovoracaceae bacterium]
MYSKFFAIMVFAVALSSFDLFAGKGASGLGNGGDTWADELKQSAENVLEFIRKDPTLLRHETTIEELTELLGEYLSVEDEEAGEIKKLKIRSRDGGVFIFDPELGQQIQVEASNYYYQQTDSYFIIFDRNMWEKKSPVMKHYLAIHEVFGLLGVEKTNDFHLSKPIVEKMFNTTINYAPPVNTTVVDLSKLKFFKELQKLRILNSGELQTEFQVIINNGGVKTGMIFTLSSRLYQKSRDPKKTTIGEIFADPDFEILPFELKVRVPMGAGIGVTKASIDEFTASAAKILGSGIEISAVKMAYGMWGLGTEVNHRALTVDFLNVRAEKGIAFTQMRGVEFILSGEVGFGTAFKINDDSLHEVITMEEDADGTNHPFSFNASASFTVRIHNRFDISLYSQTRLIFGGDSVSYTDGDRLKESHLAMTENTFGLRFDYHFNDRVSAYVFYETSALSDYRSLGNAGRTKNIYDGHIIGLGAEFRFGRKSTPLNERPEFKYCVDFLGSYREFLGGESSHRACESADVRASIYHPNFTDCLRDLKDALQCSRANNLANYN